MVQTTWLTMIEYLSKQENCKVYGIGYIVPDLYSFIDKMKTKINFHKAEDRRLNVRCLSLRGSLVKVYNSHKKGLIKQI